MAIARPTLVHTVAAHERPSDELLDARDRLRVETEDIVATYLSRDVAGEREKFLTQANIDMSAEEMDGDWAGEPDPQVTADRRFFVEHTLRPSTWWHPDLDALRTGRTRIVVGIGDISAGQSCNTHCVPWQQRSNSSRSPFPATTPASHSIPTASR